MKHLFSSNRHWRIVIRKYSMAGSARHWYPTRILLDNESEGSIALLVLNSRRITDTIDGRYIKMLWPKARIRACADGGANKLATLNREEGTKFVPDFICGDLDSALQENIDYFTKQGAVVHEDKSTINTDYTKCLRMLAKRVIDMKNEKMDTIVTVGGLYGRFDHVMGCLNTHYLLMKDYPTLNIYLVQYSSLVTLLPPGENIIHVDEEITTGICGLAPVGGPVNNVTTSGLEWNLNNETLAFGGMVSSSNRITTSQVHIRSDAPLLWILSLKV